MFPCSPLISPPPLSLYSLPLLSPLSHSLPLLLPLSPSLSLSLQISTQMDQADGCPLWAEWSSLFLHTLPVFLYDENVHFCAFEQCLWVMTRDRPQLLLGHTAHFHLYCKYIVGHVHVSLDNMFKPYSLWKWKSINRCSKSIDLR